VEPVFVSVPEMAKTLGVGRTTAWDLVWSGVLPSVKINQRRLVPMAEIRKYAERLQAEQSASAVPVALCRAPAWRQSPRQPVNQERTQ
jgi:excisionase family DNA binding protein